MDGVRWLFEHGSLIWKFWGERHGFDKGLQIRHDWGLRV